VSTVAAPGQRPADRDAVIFAPDGSTTSYGQLEERSIRLAARLGALGLRAGDHLAVLLPNAPRYYEVAFAALRSGLYLTPVNWHLTVDEAAYIVADCGARALVSSAAVADLADAVVERSPGVEVHLTDVPRGGRDVDYADAATVGSPGAAVSDVEGSYMFYSSGTTGRPKGILRSLTGQPFPTVTTIDLLMAGMYGFGEDAVYLCPAPLYHAAPLGWSVGTLRLGGTVVLMDRFDALGALELIERYRVTHVQVVPTMFVRWLKLTDGERARHDLSSLRVIVHAAAPCPVEVKDRMIDWVGPILKEYYAGSEGNGFCAIDSVEWLAHRGSVGRPLGGAVHIVAEDGAEVPVGEVGGVYFEGSPPFEYHNDPVKTAEAFDSRGWSTLGDVGYVDAEGYLYLTDRRSHMIISGGVNIYPQEVENVLALHPKVLDVAVIGVPDPEMGEQVKAVVQAADPADAGPALEQELIAYCRDRLAAFKCPRSVDFDEALPRLPTGKLAKRLLRDRYASR